MRELVYHVAVSVDGFIARTNGNAGEFAQEPGPHVDDYMAALQRYDTVLMGRKTYEFGYDFGLEPGRAPYPGMHNYVFSASLDLPDDLDPNLTRITGDPVTTVRALKAEPGAPIYLCGGGQLAGSLLRAGLVDRLVLKVNPIILGTGIPLATGEVFDHPLEAVAQKSYPNGVQLLEYRVRRQAA